MQGITCFVNHSSNEFRSAEGVHLTEHHEDVLDEHHTDTHHKLQCWRHLDVLKCQLDTTLALKKEGEGREGVKYRSRGTKYVSVFCDAVTSSSIHLPSSSLPCSVLERMLKGSAPRSFLLQFLCCQIPACFSYFWNINDYLQEVSSEPTLVNCN